MSDLEVVHRVLEGEVALFELVMRRYNRLLFRLARGVVRDDDEARDVVQDTYLRAYRKLDQFRGPHGFKSWLAQIALNEARGRLRKPLVLVDDDEDALDRPARVAVRRTGVRRHELRVATHHRKRDRRLARRLPRGVPAARRGATVDRRKCRASRDQGSDREDAFSPRAGAAAPGARSPARRAGAEHFRIRRYATATRSSPRC